MRKILSQTLTVRDLSCRERFDTEVYANEQIAGNNERWELPLANTVVGQFLPSVLHWEDGWWSASAFLDETFGQKAATRFANLRDPS